MPECPIYTVAVEVEVPIAPYEAAGVGLIDGLDAVRDDVANAIKSALGEVEVHQLGTMEVLDRQVWVR